MLQQLNTTHTNGAGEFQMLCDGVPAPHICFLQSAFTSAASRSFRRTQRGSESAAAAALEREETPSYPGVCDVEGPSPGDGHTLGVAVLRADGLLQLVQLARLLQLLHQALDSLLAPLLLLASSILLPNSSDPSPCSSAPRWGLLPAQKTFHDWRSERKDGGHGGVRVMACDGGRQSLESKLLC